MDNKTKYKVIIIEDEKTAAHLLVKALKDNFPNFEVVEVIHDGNQALDNIGKLTFDLLFLDINLSNINGFDILGSVADPSFETIIISAVDEYALKAYQFDAIDYLIKPIQIKNLTKALDKFRLIHTSKYAVENVVKQQVVTTPKLDFNPNQEIALADIYEIAIVKINDIIFCQSEGRYTKFFIKDEPNPKVVSKNLKIYEELLCNRPEFFRINKSNIVNLTHIFKIKKSVGGSVIMNNQHEISISKDKKAEFYDILKNFIMDV